MLPDASLQAISDAITAKVEQTNHSLVATPRLVVTYTHGQKIQVPKWVVDHRGHDLLPLYQSVWGGHQMITPPRLVRALRRARLLPRELATLFEELQA